MIRIYFTEWTFNREKILDKISDLEDDLNIFFKKEEYYNK